MRTIECNKTIITKGVSAMSKTRNHLTLSVCFLLAVVLSLSASPLLAQRGGGKIEGTVVDSTGAV